MTGTRRLPVICSQAMLVALLGVAGCSDTNESLQPFGEPKDEGNGSPAPDGGTGTGGGTSTSSSGGNAGATTETTDGAAPGGGTSTGGGGAQSTAGSTATTVGGLQSGTLLEHFTPTCLDLGFTVAGEEIKKNTVCTADDPQACWRTCGPATTGRKTEICIDGRYHEGDCIFPEDEDYFCFAIPDTIDPSCPTDTEPKATVECTVASCTPCNSAGNYETAGGEVKPGYCVCWASDSGTSRWTCGTRMISWPCPGGAGC